jgi:hypothetical protein
MIIEDIVAHLFFLMYISILCIWWYREVENGGFD